MDWQKNVLIRLRSDVQARSSSLFFSLNLIQSFTFVHIDSDIQVLT